MEQAEQLAESAGAIGYAARPILLYYMLNQAARTIVAAHGAEADVSGHGLVQQNLKEPNLADVRVGVHKTGLVHALADALPWVGTRVKFGRLAGNMSAGDLWAYLPRCGTWAAQAGLADACALWIERQDAGEGVSTIRVSGWPWSTATLGPETINEVVDRVMALLHARYGVSAGWSVCRNPPDSFLGNMPKMRFDSAIGPFTMAFELSQPHPRPPDATLGQIIVWDDFGTSVRSGEEEWVLPSIPGCGHVHPLVAWYATLWLFSMLARYEPVAWRGHLDVDQSGYAVALQRTLDAASECVPTLIAEALDAQH
jgi:hypothetical protein